MNLGVLLEAAKYVEYRTQTEARGEQPVPFTSFSKLSPEKKDASSGVYSEASPPKTQQSASNSSSHSPEEIKEKKRSISHLRDSSLSHEHSNTGTREVHNKLEKNRRAHLKECFESLKSFLPITEDRKTSNLSILRGAIRFIQILKRKEREYEHDMERLAREKIAFQQRLAVLKKEIAAQMDNGDINHIVPHHHHHEDDNETTTTASECGNLSDFDDLPESPPKKRIHSPKSATAAASTSNSHVRSIVTPTASTVIQSKPGIPPSRKHTPEEDDPHPIESFVTESRSVIENKTSVLASPGPENSASSNTRVFSTNNLHTMTGIFAAPHGMQVITQPSGIKVITTPNTIMASNNSVQHISVNQPPTTGQIHLLAQTSAGVPYSTSKSPIADSIIRDSLVQANKGMQKSHLVSPLALVSQQGMVELSHASPIKSNISDLIATSGGHSIKSGATVLPNNVAISVKNGMPSNNGVSSGNQSNMIATLHVSKPHSQVIQSSLAPGIITQGPTINNGTHHGISNSKQLSSPVRSLPHISGITHLATPMGGQINHISPLVSVSRSPINHVAPLMSVSRSMAPIQPLVSFSRPTPVGHVAPLVRSQINHVAPLVSVVSHTGHPGKVLASPVLKSVPLIQQQYLQQVSVGSQPMVKPVVVVSMPSVVTSGQVKMADVGRGATNQK